jgi:hypothetical protein
MTVAEASFVLISYALSPKPSVAPDLIAPGCLAKLSLVISVARELDKEMPRLEPP